VVAERQGRFERAFFHADTRRLCALRTRTVEGQVSRVECRKRQSGSRPSTLEPSTIVWWCFFFCLGAAVQEHAGDAALRPPALGLLAAGTFFRAFTAPGFSSGWWPGKIPLFVLTAGSCVATVLVPEKLTASHLSFGLRVENAVVSTSPTFGR